MLTANNRVLKIQSDELTEDRDENQMNYLNQYTHETILRIQKDLEEYVIKVLQSIGVTIDSYGLVGVHQLGKVNSHKSHNVIVRFLNHKKKHICLGSCQTTEYRVP